ncbi:hypothetical protein LIER_28015 [Lithospermum erythrorhizon]|uniref:Uncharacterized protein n=1 Tax=Lithospermum erythrorhizon TaxID=34254 RepID=A0AAV3RE61_LITER
MVSTKKLIKMAKKWQRIAALNRKRIPFPNNNKDESTSEHSSMYSVAKKGHFIAYTADGKRYSIPIAYLQSAIFRELFKMSEEEYGISNEGPIALPCDSVFMDYLISLTSRKTSMEIEQALLLSIVSNRCSSSCSMYQQEICQHVVPCSS